MASEDPEKKGQKADGNSAPTSVLELLKSFSAAAGVLTGLAFISGWLYWAAYYTAFGLNSLTLNVAFSVVSVSLIQVVVRDFQSEGFLLKVILILAGFAVLAFMRLFARWYKHRHAGATWLMVILALGMLVGSWKLALNDAAYDGGCFSRLPVITFELIAPTDQAGPPPHCQVGDNEVCHLVLHSDNTYRFVVAPDRQFCDGGLRSPGAGRAMYEISDAQVRKAEILHYVGW